MYHFTKKTGFKNKKATSGDVAFSFHKKKFKEPLIMERRFFKNPNLKQNLYTNESLAGYTLGYLFQTQSGFLHFPVTDKPGDGKSGQYIEAGRYFFNECEQTSQHTKLFHSK